MPAGRQRYCSHGRRQRAYLWRRAAAVIERSDEGAESTHPQAVTVVRDGLHDADQIHSRGTWAVRDGSLALPVVQAQVEPRPAAPRGPHDVSPPALARRDPSRGNGSAAARGTTASGHGAQPVAISM